MTAFQNTPEIQAHSTAWTVRRRDPRAQVAEAEQKLASVVAKAKEHARALQAKMEEEARRSGGL